MITEKQKRERIRNEYKAMCALPYSPIMSWALAPGCTRENPNAYLVTFHNPTIVKPGSFEKKQDVTTVRINLPDDFPNSAPSVIVVDGDIPWHPNWWRDGRMCVGNIWSVGMWLYKFISKVGRVLAFDKGVTNVNSPANHDAIKYWEDHKNTFPVGRLDFPHPRGYQ